MKQQKNSGFSLIEVIIAMAVFTIGALGLYGMQINSARWNTKANQQTSAVLVASQVIEQLMREDYKHAALNVTDTELNVTDTTISKIDKCHDADVDVDDDTCRNEGHLPGLTFVYPPGEDSLIKSVIWIVNQVPDNNNMKQVHVSVRYGAGDRDRIREGVRDREVNMSFLKVNLPKN